MSAIDWMFIGIVAISMALGAMRGAMREVVNIAGWVLAFVLSYSFAGSLAPQFADWVGEPVVRLALAWLAIFLGVLVLAGMAAGLLSEIVRKLGLGTLDRLVGAMVGLARGILLSLAIVLVAGMTRIPQSAAWRNAVLTPWLEIAALSARGLLPDAVAAKIRYRAPNTNNTKA